MNLPIWRASDRLGERGPVTSPIPGVVTAEPLPPRSRWRDPSRNPDMMVPPGSVICLSGPRACRRWHRGTSPAQLVVKSMAVDVPTNQPTQRARSETEMSGKTSGASARAHNKKTDHQRRQEREGRRYPQAAVVCGRAPREQPPAAPQLRPPVRRPPLRHAPLAGPQLRQPRFRRPQLRQPRFRGAQLRSSRRPAFGLPQLRTSSVRPQRSSAHRPQRRPSPLRAQRPSPVREQRSPVQRLPQRSSGQ